MPGFTQSISNKLLLLFSADFRFSKSLKQGYITMQYNRGLLFCIRDREMMSYKILIFLMKS